MTGYSSLKTIIHHLSPASRKKQPRKRGCRPVFKRRRHSSPEGTVVRLVLALRHAILLHASRMASLLGSQHPPLSAASKARLLRAGSALLIGRSRPFEDSVLSGRHLLGIDGIEIAVPLVDSRRLIQQEGYLDADTVGPLRGKVRAAALCGPHRRCPGPGYM